MAYLIRAIFSFWYGTILTYKFAGIKNERKTTLSMVFFFIIAMLLQTVTSVFGSQELSEQLYPFTTHIPLILWIILVHGVKWEISFGAVITAYLCCELPNWFSQFAAIPFDSNYTVQVIVYCISCIVILLLLCRHVAPSLLSMFSKSRKFCLIFTTVPFLYYLWCYAATVYSSYMEKHGYQVAFTMSALFTLLFLFYSIAQNRSYEAVRSDNAKSAFLANMSHEIRTPINAILGVDEMILRECTDSQILDYAEKIKDAGKTLLYLINDILDLSKIESGRMELTPAQYDLKQLISEVLLLIEPRAEEKNLQLCYDIDPHLPSKLYGDDLRIKQILINLLTNAVKYTNEGKVTLSLQLVEKDERKATIHVSVRDTGIGIREEHRDALFESFRRVDLARNKNIEGTGLGLSITLRLLHLMHSDLGLQSVYNIGSDFYFDLCQDIVDHSEIGTFEKASLSNIHTETYREGFRAPNAQILVVDDNDINLLVFRGLMKNSEMKIVEARSGSEALEKISQNAFHMVFMDHLMPDMDGIETLQHIRASELLTTNAGVVIILTANAISGAKDMYLQAGFSDYLKKPISGQELERTIRTYLPPELILPITATPSANPDTTEILDLKLGLACCDGDNDFYHEVLQAFLQSDFAALLNENLRNEDWTGYETSIHGLKSGAKTIGAMKISNLAKELELALKERQDTPLVISKHPMVLSELSSLETLITDTLNR